MSKLVNEDNDDDDDDDDDDLDLPIFPSDIDPSKAVSGPEGNDVICGRGKSITHPGNLKFRQLVLARKDEYKRAKRRDDKTRIAFEIVEALRNGPDASRFLLKDVKSGLWFDVGEVYAREKVSHALRSRPNEERRRKCPRKKLSRKQDIPIEFEKHVNTLIMSQQQLLKSMIENETIPGTQFETDSKI